MAGVVNEAGNAYPPGAPGSTSYAYGPYLCIGCPPCIKSHMLYLSIIRLDPFEYRFRYDCQYFVYFDPVLTHILYTYPPEINLIG